VTGAREAGRLLASEDPEAATEELLQESWRFAVIHEALKEHLEHLQDKTAFLEAALAVIEGLAHDEDGEGEAFADRMLAAELLFGLLVAILPRNADFLMQVRETATRFHETRLLPALSGSGQDPQRKGMGDCICNVFGTCVASVALTALCWYHGLHIEYGDLALLDQARLVSGVDSIPRLAPLLEEVRAGGGERRSLRRVFERRLAVRFNSISPALIPAPAPTPSKVVIRAEAAPTGSGAALVAASPIPFPKDGYFDDGSPAHLAHPARVADDEGGRVGLRLFEDTPYTALDSAIKGQLGAWAGRDEKSKYPTPLRRRALAVPGCAHNAEVSKSSSSKSSSSNSGSSSSSSSSSSGAASAASVLDEALAVPAAPEAASAAEVAVEGAGAAAVAEPEAVGAAAAEWKSWTPKEINCEFCMARTWADGVGGQCGFRRITETEFCTRHTKQNLWQVHGRVDGPIPEAKLREFRAKGKGRKVEVEVRPAEAPSGGGGAEVAAGGEPRAPRKRLRSKVAEVPLPEPAQGGAPLKARRAGA